MATRYWVGGSGTWIDGGHWSSTSGGIGADLLSEELFVGGDFESGLPYGNTLVNTEGGALATWGLNTNLPISGATDGLYSVTQAGTNIYRPYLNWGSYFLGNIAVGRLYRISFNYKVNSGVLSFSMYNGASLVSGTSLTGQGVFTTYLLCLATPAFGNIYLNGTKLVNAQIDNYSVKQVLTYPTLSDDVIFDSNSGTGTITINAIANMRNCTFAQTQLITLVNAAYAFNIFGSWTLCGNTYLNTSFTGTGYVYLKATTSVNITSNGCTRGWNRLYFDGVDGTWTNQDDMNIANSNILLRNGTWDTNSVNITTTGTFDIISGVQTLTLRNSIFSFYNFVPSEIGYNLTENTATLYFSGNIFFALQKKFKNIIITNQTQVDLFALESCENLTYNLNSGNILARLVISSNIIVDNTIIINGFNSKNYRLVILSSVINTSKTITCNGTITSSNVDFRDIVGSGSANWNLSAITGGSGDCGGNSGITFTPAQTQYFKHTSGAVNWSDATKWFSNYERTIAGRVPLPQDNAIFDENSFTGASTLTINVPRIGGMLINSINQSLSVVLANSLLAFLNFKLGASVLSGNYLVEFDGHNRTFASSVYLGISNSAPNNFTVLGNNTFAELILEPDRKVKFTAGTTQTVSKLKALGSLLASIRIDSTSSSRFNLVKTGSEPNECNFIDISNSNASPSGSWPAGYNSNDMGNNAGWEFNTDDFVPQIINL